MGVPFEALLPYALMCGVGLPAILDRNHSLMLSFQMFMVTGGGLAAIRAWQNEGKRPRYNTDIWDRVCLALRIPI